ncbi:hypothetical protein K474DRAFT_1386467 [Panus rudis PR-1116 ss-1]|nr:hypothetical protein K474DRAFT_1386467 [Panus rudis PR-1116 ss-1]
MSVVPLRATQASAEMKKLMSAFRLDPFTMHPNSVGAKSAKSKAKAASKLKCKKQKAKAAKAKALKGAAKKGKKARGKKRKRDESDDEDESDALEFEVDFGGLMEDDEDALDDDDESGLGMNWLGEPIGPLLHEPMLVEFEVALDIPLLDPALFTLALTSNSPLFSSSPWFGDAASPYGNIEDQMCGQNERSKLGLGPSESSLMSFRHVFSLTPRDLSLAAAIQAELAASGGSANATPAKPRDEPPSRHAQSPRTQSIHPSSSHGLSEELLYSSSSSASRLRSDYWSSSLSSHSNLSNSPSIAVPVSMSLPSIPTLSSSVGASHSNSHGSGNHSSDPWSDSAHGGSGNASSGRLGFEDLLTASSSSHSHSHSNNRSGSSSGYRYGSMHRSSDSGSSRPSSSAAGSSTSTFMTPVQSLQWQMQNRGSASSASGSGSGGHSSLSSTTTPASGSSAHPYTGMFLGV